jgi:hypothetical protein
MCGSSQHHGGDHRWDFAPRRIVLVVARNLLHLHLVPLSCYQRRPSRAAPVNRGWHMNHPGGPRNGRDRGSSLSSHIGAPCRDLEASTQHFPADRFAGLVDRVDSTPAARR